MKKIYQPIVIEETDYIINGLIESEFFEDFEITDYSFARQHIMDSLSEKYLNNLLSESDNYNEELYTEQEFDKLLKEIVAGSILHELKNDGVLGSYEDETTEEQFFLTDKGRELLIKNKTIEPIKKNKK